jgi:hypothetical protein
MKWQAKPKRGTCWVETEDKRWRVTNDYRPMGEDGFIRPIDPMPPCPYLLYRGKQLIGGFATLREAQEKAHEMHSPKP